MQHKKRKTKSRQEQLSKKMDREESVKMWTNIKYAVKDPRSSQVLKVQRLEHGAVCEYTSKEDIEKWSKKGTSPYLH